MKVFPSKLSDLLKTITPLPWPDDGFGMTPLENATHAELDRGDWIMARHAANLLPELVEALRGLRACIDDCKGHGTPVIRDRAEAYLALSLAESALARAGEVRVAK